MGRHLLSLDLPTNDYIVIYRCIVIKGMIYDRFASNDLSGKIFFPLRAVRATD